MFVSISIYSYCQPKLQTIFQIQMIKLSAAESSCEVSVDISIYRDVLMNESNIF